MCKQSERRGRVIVISGFSGTGKGTMIQKLMETYPGEYALSVSWTTRQPRPGEIPGVSYHYKSEAEFEDMIAQDNFLEYARYADCYYGTPLPFIRENLEAGRDVILEIELQGAMQVQKIFPKVKLIFITTKDADTLEARLRGRQTEKEEKIIKRLTQATVEADGIESYQYVIVNNDLDQAVAELRRDILDEEAPSPDREKIGLVRKLQADLKVRLGLV